MSRVGKKPVPVPSGVTANVSGTTINVKGPKGNLSLVFDDRVAVEMDKGEIKVDPKDESKAARALWGTTRANLNNIMTGVTKGFERKLEITGVGYRASVQGKNLQLALGYSHDVLYPIPEGIAVVTPKPTEIVVTGIDKKKVGQVAAEIRAYRPPEPYKGKGVQIRRRIHLPQGRQEEVTIKVTSNGTQISYRAPSVARTQSRQGCGQWPYAADGPSFVEAHLRPGDR